MQTIKKRILILVMVLIVVGVVSNLLGREKYVPRMNVMNLKNFPLNYKGWIGERITMQQKVYDILETNALVLNSYSKEGKAVMLAIVYYPDVKVDFHSPEACAGGRGVKINKQIKAIQLNELGTIKVNELNIERPNSKELVYYFYKSGRFVGNNYNWLRFNLIANNLFYNQNSGSLVRVSSTIRENEKQASSDLTLFLNDFGPVIKTYL